MNKRLKMVLVSINVIMFIIAVFWYLEEKEKEPFIVCLGQIVTVIGIAFDRNVSKIFTKKIENSELKIKRQDGDHVHAEEIKDSKIHID